MQTLFSYAANPPRAKRLRPLIAVARAAARTEVTVRFVVRTKHSQPALLLEARGGALTLDRIEASVRAQALKLHAVELLPVPGLHLYLVELARAPLCASRRNAITAEVRRCLAHEDIARSVESADDG